MGEGEEGRGFCLGSAIIVNLRNNGSMDGWGGGGTASFVKRWGGAKNTPWNIWPVGVKNTRFSW